MQPTKKVTSFGFVGLSSFAYLAYCNPSTLFYVYDFEQANIAQYKNGNRKICQLQQQQHKKYFHSSNLIFSSNISQVLDDVQIIFLAASTPTKQMGQNAGKSIDISLFQNTLVSIINYYNNNQSKISSNLVLAEKSTVPIGTHNMIKKIIGALVVKQLQNRYIIISCPELLPNVPTIDQLLNPDRIIIGCQYPHDKITKFISLFSKYLDKLIYTNNSSSQLARLVTNCFLAQRISSINSISICCQQFDQADIKQIKNCIGADKRIGDKFLTSGVGFGGRTMKKDLLAVIYLAQSKGLHQVAQYWKMVLEMNSYRKKTFFKRIFKQLHSNLKGKKLAIFGISFKQNTGDTFESPALDICKDLLIQGAILQIYDPKASIKSLIQDMKYSKIWKDNFEQRIIQYKTPQQSVTDAQAIIILTQWHQFKTIDYNSFYQKVQKPAIIFDGRNILDQDVINQMLFNVVRIGKYFKDKNQ